MLLSIKNISKRYKNGIDALSDVSLDVEKGEFISIIGPSGSGKSTLLRSINKMIDVTSGSIYFENHDITNMKKKEIKNIRREMGMIFQNFEFLIKMVLATIIWWNGLRLLRTYFMVSSATNPHFLPFLEFTQKKKKKKPLIY